MPDADRGGHIVLCGLGHAGWRILCLLARLGERVTVITHDEQPDWMASAREQARVLPGDPRDDNLLREAGVESARAVIAVTDEDMTNVSIALDARCLNPAATVVIRVFDQALAGRLEDSLGLSRALSTSALAAPAFAAAALGGAVRGTFDCDGQDFVIEAVDEGRLTGAGWAMIAGARGGEPPLWVGPAGTARGRLGRPVRMGSLRRLTSAVRGAWCDAPRALRSILLVLLLVVAASMLVFHFALNLPLIDSLYFVVTVVTTTGFGDYNLMGAPAALKLYGVFLMLCGAALIATLFSLVTDILVRSRLRDLLSHSSARETDHVVVCGLGSIGYRVARRLAGEGVRIVSVERDPRGAFVESAKSLGPVVLGDASSSDTLARAGVRGACAVLAATDDDLANLGIALATKRENPAARVVLRVFDAKLAEKMTDAVGVDAVMSVSGAAAPAFVAAAVCPGALHGIVLRDRLLVLYRREVSARCPAAGDCERVLLARAADGQGFVPVEPEAALDGATVIGVRTLPLSVKTGG